MPDTPTNPVTLPNLSASARLVVGALAEVHEVAVIELTAAAGVSKSTVAKTLTLLEHAGAATRTIREADGVREADLWSPGPAIGALLVTDTGASHTDGTQGPSGIGGADAVRPDHSSSDGSSRDDSVSLETGASDDSVNCDDQLPRTSALTGTESPEDTIDRPPAVDPAAQARPPSQDAPSGTARERLAPGGLAELVAAVLTAHPEVEYSPTMLSHLLNGRSSGAISNALEKMITIGSAVRTCDKPRRYRHACPQASNRS